MIPPIIIRLNEDSSIDTGFDPELNYGRLAELLNKMRSKFEKKQKRKTGLPPSEQCSPKIYQC